MPVRHIGDVYELPRHAGQQFFMQHIDNDSSQLGSHVVRVFAGVAETAGVEPGAASTLATAFFVHVLLRAGETLKVWRKVGSAPIDAVSPTLTWRTCLVSERQAPIASSWQVWRTNGTRRTVRPEAAELLKSEVGMVMAPPNVVERAHTGKWSVVYPKVGSSQPSGPKPSRGDT